MEAEHQDLLYTDGGVDLSKARLFVLSSCFLIASGFIYTLERFIAYVTWVGQLDAPKASSYPNAPSLPGIFTNWFVAIFTLISVVLFFIGLRRNET